MLKFNSQNKFIHLKLIILGCMGTFYRSKGIKATALNFSIFKGHIYMKLNVFIYNNVYLSIIIYSSLHFVIFAAPIFHFIKALENYFLWFL